MAISKRQAITGLSVLYLLALTILAAYALHSSHVYSLPIPDVLCAFVVALPPLAGVALETVISLNEKLAAKGQLQASRIFQVTIAFFLILESSLATLAGAHIWPPGSLNCALRKTWTDFFDVRNGMAIKRIQDTFSCCGLDDVRDMAFPFPDAVRGSDACVVKYGREKACLGAWRGEERKVAIFLLVVPLAVFVWQVAIVLAPSSQSSWLPSQIQLPSSQGSDNVRRQGPMPGIGYRDLEDQEEDSSLHRTVTDLNKDSQLATHVERQRTKSSGVVNEVPLRREGDGEEV